MNTKRFRTKTEFIQRQNIKANGVWEIAIDIGYSAVKLFSPNMVACFPSFARRVDEKFGYISDPPASSLIYRDEETGQRWLVGEVAQNTTETGDTSNSESSLYGRERYGSTMFKVLLETGLALGSLSGDPAERIVIQTGLPEAYMGTDDEEMLRDAFAGDHRFSLRVGNGQWHTYTMHIEARDIFIMPQPKGTLFSICIDENGKFHPDTRDYLNSPLIVFDPGFGTLDLYSIVSGAVKGGETFQDLGMRRVFQETAKLIKEKYGVNVTVPEMQKNLETGNVTQIDKRNRFSAKEVPIGDLLEEATKKVCDEAINRTADVFKLADFKYLVITGGTSAAWQEQIEETLKGLPKLKIVHGNQNEEMLPYIYSNVRGYYFYRYTKLK